MPHELANDYDDNTEKQNKARDILILSGIVGNFAQGIPRAWIT